ncbi:SDR family NAD(P)-dependent oxidoreductase [Lactiplantibacillus xiangfangensis]|uniref:3-hydroxybutyrate dehydrogenase n=1 Tax=Lactiplantibacillus xiangfangensis TaxID=942150 RepID=A0A0R2MFA0_9LACO|nr:SDR family oxidoreductase [Lactiplantibacillus xiangfangensis]KRO10827.1 3-hydroxybutyrate dehydrogenase [Lactiplantibacillus xiangfangensis]
MEMGLEHKRVLVTGSTKGIGRAIATAFAKEGADVVINGRRADTVQAVVEQLAAAYPETTPVAAPFDISDPTEAEKLFKSVSTVDVLVNNMGIFAPMAYADIDDATWDRFFKVNVLSGNRLAKHYLPSMLANDFGRIIFIASEEAVMPSGEMPQYSMTKSMNLSLAKSLSKLTVGTHVTVNTVMPGSTLTEGVQHMLDEMYADSDLPKDQWEHDFMVNHRPLSQIQRLIRPEEIGRLTVFVASPFASSFSGEALRADGGLVPTLY